MASVISSNVHSDRAMKSGSRYIRFRFVLEDNNNVQHDHITHTKLYPADFDADAAHEPMQQTILEAYRTVEIMRIQRMQPGVNPLTRAQNSQWGSLTGVAKALLLWMINERDPRIVIFLEPLIVYVQANYNASQIASFLGLSVTQVARMSDRINAILSDIGTVKDNINIFDSYEGFE